MTTLVACLHYDSHVMPRLRNSITNCRQALKDRLPSYWEDLDVTCRATAAVPTKIHNPAFAEQLAQYIQRHPNRCPQLFDGGRQDRARRGCLLPEIIGACRSRSGRRSGRRLAEGPGRPCGPRKERFRIEPRFCGCPAKARAWAGSHIISTPRQP